MKILDKKTLENIFKHQDMLWREFVDIANAAGYLVTTTWNKETGCVVLEKKPVTQKKDTTRRSETPRSC